MRLCIHVIIKCLTVEVGHPMSCVVVSVGIG